MSSSTQLPPPPMQKPRMPAGSPGHHKGGVQPPQPAQDVAQAPPEHDEVDLSVPPARRSWVLTTVIILGLVLAGLLAFGLIPRLRGSAELAKETAANANAPVPVNVVTPRRAPQVLNVQMPGTLRPWQEVSLYARTTGYLAHYYVDISNQVKKGQVMAEIDSPEVDAQLRGAEATLQQEKAAANKARTDMEFAQSTLSRYESLRSSNSVTQQELDTYRANFNSANATLRSAEANVAVGEAEVKRLTEMKSFEKITAPFSGVVTGRAYDVGAMILANPTSTDTQPLFKIAENDVLRAFVYVPQTYALTVKKDMEVKITAREIPGRVFTGTVMGTTNYLDPNARSLMTEVKIPNADLALLPGMYVDVSFEVKRDHPPFILPAAAVVSTADGNQVGVVEKGKLHFRNVQLGVDYGNDIEIVSGLTGDEQIVGNPGGRTIEGAEVKTVGTSQAAEPK